MKCPRAPWKEGSGELAVARSPRTDLELSSAATARLFGRPAGATAQRACLGRV